MQKNRMQLNVGSYLSYENIYIYSTDQMPGYRFNQTFIDFNAALKKNPTRSFGIESSADICKMKTEYRSTQTICNCMPRDICNLKAQLINADLCKCKPRY